MKPQINHIGHRGVLINKKLHKVFQSTQSISLCALWLGCLRVLCGYVLTIRLVK